MQTSVVLCLFACVLLQLCTAQMSVPRRELGFVYGDGRPCASVKLHAFVDLSCPDSAKAYSTLKEVVASYGERDVQLRVHLFSLPYHRNSHTLAKAAQVLNEFQSPINSTVFDWLDIVYRYVNEFKPCATANMTDKQVLNKVAVLAEAATGISPTAFLQQIADHKYDEAARLGWKYGCTRGVYGTPMFSLNDVFVEASADWSVAQWKALIDPLLKDESHTLKFIPS